MSERTSTAAAAGQDEQPMPVIVWCCPRSCSTAFERAFMQSQSTRCFHEPTAGGYYYGPQRACQRYDEAACKASGQENETVEGTLRGMLDPEVYNKDTEKKEGARYIFAKDMAQYLFSGEVLSALHPDSKVYRTPSAAQSGVDYRHTLENPTVVPTELLRRFKHTFLVRTPEKSVPSYYKCVQDKAAGFEYFDGAEAGYAELRILYQWLSNPRSSFHTDPPSSDPAAYPGKVQEQPQPPPLVDASVLLANPERTIRLYCEAVGFPFDEGMLSWEKKSVPEFSSWGTFHAAAEQSTGFKADAETGASSAKKADLPAEVQQTIERSMADYEWLYERRTIREE